MVEKLGTLQGLPQLSIQHTLICMTAYLIASILIQIFTGHKIISCLTFFLRWQVFKNIDPSCAKIENPNCSSMIMKWAYYPLDLIYFVINWTAILTMMLNLPHLRNWKIPPLALQIAKLFFSMTWYSDFRKSLPKKKKTRNH